MKDDLHRAVWWAPLHFLMSMPVAVAAFVVPPVGSAYVKWREAAEANDVVSGRDSELKSKIDLISQTALVQGALKVWGKD